MPGAPFVASLAPSKARSPERSVFAPTLTVFLGCKGLLVESGVPILAVLFPLLRFLDQLREGLPSPP